MASFRLNQKRNMRIDAGRRALSLIAQGVTMNDIAAQLCGDVGPHKEKRSRTWLYRAMEEADKTDKNCQNVTAQTDTNCHAVAQDIDSDPALQ